MFIFPAFFGRAKIAPLAGVFRGARISFLLTDVFYVKVRLIYKLCCYFMNFCKSKSCNLLVSMYQNTAAGRDEIRAPLKRLHGRLSEDKRKVGLRPEISYFLCYLRVQRKQERYARRLARDRRGARDTRDRGSSNLFLPSLPPVAPFALHARLALAFARLKSACPAGLSSWLVVWFTE